jgi:hypothetical protein
MVKRATWLATKVSFFILAPICAICFLGIAAAIMYKSGFQGVSPIRLLTGLDADQRSKILDGLLATVELLVAGVAICAVAGGLLGAVFGAISRLRKSLGSSGPRP